MATLSVENRKSIDDNSLDSNSLDAMNGAKKNFIFRRHLNKLRWLILASVFALLIVIPFLHLYQSYLAANAYELLADNEKIIFNVAQEITNPFTQSPETDLDNIKGTTWSGTLFGLKLSDPLAVVTNIIASGWNLVFALTALVPILVTLVFGRVFCGWICPATFLYELNDNLGTWLHKMGLPIAPYRFKLYWKYIALFVCVLLTIPIGSTLITNIYPPAVLGREMYYVIAMGSFGIGIMFFAVTMLFDLLVSRRGFCRYLCPGGALYSLLGRFRILRIQRDVSQCNDCAKCNTVCQFGLSPMQDGFGQECNNCTACIAICPTDTLGFEYSIKDMQYQGAGHLGAKFKLSQEK